MLVTAVAALLLVALGLIVVQTTTTAWPFIVDHGTSFVDSRRWAPSHDAFGALAFVYGTLVTALLALAIAVPVSVGIAVFMTDLAPRRLRVPLTYLIDLLAAIPSVVYGLWAALVLVPPLVQHVWRPASSALGFVPLLGGPAYGQSIATAAVVLAIMIVPIVTSLSREAIALVPTSQREAAAGLGATRWEVVRHAVLPYARSGIVGAIVLGLGRAMGETIAVLLVIGATPKIPDSIFKPGYTMAGVIANELPEAGGTHTEALVALGVLLFVITIAVNMVALAITRRSVRALG